MILKLINKLTNRETDLFVEDMESSRLFYHFQTDFQGLDEGEYRYELFDDYGSLLETGLLQLGLGNTTAENADNNTQYNDEEITYTQYEG